MVNWDYVISIAILLFIILIIYSKVKNKTLRESYEEFRDLILPRTEE